jgi:hypothetical protein
MAVKDIKLDENGDINISGGDFEAIESDQIHIEHILKSNKGYYFEFPLLGVGIINELNGSTSSQNLKQKIRRQLVLDNYLVKKINVSLDNIIDINAIRKI